MKKILVLTLVVIAMFAIAIPVFGNGPVHKVVIGGPDAGFIGPGIDANFSLEAIEFADGSVTGQYTDQFGHGNGGFHAVIDCLYVDGNQAWVSGVITSESVSGDGSFVGLPVGTRMVDNGTSANDTPDQISFSFFDPTPCTDMPDYPLLDAPNGQVIVD